MSEDVFAPRYAIIIGLLRSVHTWAEFDTALEMILTLYGDPDAPKPQGVIHADLD